MRSFAIIAAAALASAMPHEAFDEPALHDAKIAEINARPGLTWKAGRNTRFEGMTLAEAKRLMGTIKGTPLAKVAKRKHSEWDQSPLPLSALPASFDVRTGFPWASNITSIVRDQSSCGSCWAFGSTEAFNDRLAIAHNYSTVLSAADTLTCWCVANCAGSCELSPERADHLVRWAAALRRCTFTVPLPLLFPSPHLPSLPLTSISPLPSLSLCSGGFDCLGSSGCDGGMPDEAWAWFVSKGVVTGAGYDTNTGCYPYPFEVCAHHVTEPGIPDCPTNEFPTPSCAASCANGQYSVPYASDKHFAQTSYNLNDVASTMTDLVTRGTVTTSFNVYDDFLTYTSGVYTCPSNGNLLGGHSVSIIGYGTDSASGMDYWLVRNSWNSGWGDNGLFKIRRGTDECGIEDDLVAGQV